MRGLLVPAENILFLNKISNLLVSKLWHIPFQQFHPGHSFFCFRSLVDEYNVELNIRDEWDSTPLYVFIL